jgi:D-serine deaminase-like pyridoxal phosphate-dependent protein
VVAGLAAAFGPKETLTVLVECDTGGGRCGAQDPSAALALARMIAGAPGLRFGGLLTYPAPGSEAAVERFFAATMALLAAEGLDCPIRSTGGTPGLFRAAEVPSATEFRAGTYVYNDRKILSGGSIGPEDCAMTVLATVVSRPAPGRMILDAGSKVLSSDLLGLTGYGSIPALPGAVISGLSEEHGHVDVSACTVALPGVGARVEILPNHTCVVTNLADQVTFHRAGEVVAMVPVAARGRVW